MRSRSEIIISHCRTYDVWEIQPTHRNAINTDLKQIDDDKGYSLERSCSLNDGRNIMAAQSWNREKKLWN